MKLDESKIKEVIDVFLKQWTADSSNRFASFDFCYSYFNSFDDKREIANEKNIEKSCLQLGFYLASWGMLRASSFLINKSLRYYKDLIETIANTPQRAWDIDINTYDKDSELLIETYKSISSHFDDHRHLTLTTKIMLGVFGNAPAFDDFFCTTFRKLYPGNGFRAFNKDSIQTVYEFYKENNQLIDSYGTTLYCKDFVTGENYKFNYKKSKIVDMIGFQYSFRKR